jgi:tetratricopeptide (TPR) repeat protein
MLCHAAMLAHIHGRLEEADQLIEDAVAAGTDGGEPDAVLLYAGAHIWLRRDQGRTDEVLDLIEECVESYPRIAAWPASHAAALCDVGRHDEAREALVNADLERLPHDFITLTALTQWAETCARVGLADRAEELYGRLEPFRAQLANNGVAPIGVVAHFLGCLATCLGDHERAERDFRQAVEIYRRIDAPVLLARTELAWGRALMSRGEDADHERGSAMLESALATAQAAGALGIVTRAEAALA